MKKRLFGVKPESTSSEDAEKEAAAELNRLTRQSRPPQGSGGVAGSGYRNLTGGKPGMYGDPSRPREPPARPSVGGQPLPTPVFGAPGGVDDDDADDDQPFSIRAEEEAVTELALRDWAAQGRGSRNFEDYALVGLDRGSAEAQRDRALREALARQQKLQQEFQARRAQALRDDPNAVVRVVQPPSNANLGRPNITYATSAPGASRVNVARQDAIGAAGRERSARAAAPRPEGPMMTPAARRAKAAEAATAATKKAPAPKKVAPAAKKATPAATKKAPAAKKNAPAAKKVAPAAKKVAPAARRSAPAPAPPPEPPRLLTPAARRALAAEEAAKTAGAGAARSAQRSAPASRKPLLPRAARTPPAARPEPPPEPPLLLTPAARRALAAERAAAEAAGKVPAPRRGSGRSGG